jgi:hypothetical protein
MRNGTIGIAAAFIVGVGLAFGGQFTDTDKAANHGKTGLDNLTAEIDANFAIIEGVFPSATVISNKYLKVWHPNGSTTTTNLTVAGTVTVPAGSIAVAALAAGLTKNATASTTDLKIRYGTATNNQAVTWGETFTALVWATIMDDITGTNGYFSATSTSGGTAKVAASHTNRWIAIGR